MPETRPTTIRLTDEEREEAMRKADEHGLRTLSDLFRLALKRLRSPQK